MKKIITLALAALLVFTTLAVFAGCNQPTNNGEETTLVTEPEETKGEANTDDESATDKAAMIKEKFEKAVEQCEY